MYRNYIKRVVDFLLGIVGFLILSPLFFLVLFILLISNGGKPFFFQERPGKDGEIFRIIKFKTMNDKKDANGELLPFEKRVTRLGLFIRKYSLDEIPQLINVIIGDMSLIGPRPLLVQYLPLYSDYQKQRHDVRPGITGWAQINGRNSLSWTQKFEFDVWYVKNISFLLDTKIFFKTIKKVIIREGVNKSETINMTSFTGDN